MRTFAQRQKQPQNRVSSSLARSHPAALGPDHREHPILHLQRTISNQAVQRMLQTHAQELEAGFTGMATPRFGHDLSRIPIHRRAAGAIQTKLAINEPGDSYEQEADRVADQIMSVDEAHPQPKDDCACGGKCAECRASAMTPSTVQLSLSNSVRDIHAMPAPETSAQREAGTGELTVQANTIQRQIETKEEQGDCSGWESDCESFCRAAARQYWKDVDGVDPPLTEGLSECSRPRGGGQAFCTLRYKTGQVVRVALWQKKVIEVWRTDSSKKDPGYDAPSCDYTYSCSAKDRTIAFKKISCTDYRSPAPKRESQEPQMSSPIQRQSDRRSSFTEAPPMVEEILRSPGKPLDMATRAFMESRLGHAFSRVRVHTDARAALSANAIHARAYTAGSHIVFAGGEYAPRTAEGGRLLAHELAHVVQQSGGRAVVQRAPAPEIPTQLEAMKPPPTLRAPAKAGHSMSTLRAKSAEVQRQLQGFSGLKEWRLAFHASNDETLREINQLFEELRKLQTELSEILDKWYFTLVENTRLTDAQRRLNDTWKRLAEEYWKLRRPSDAEKAYELQSQKVEAGLMQEQAAIIAEIGRLEKAGTPPSPGQYESLLTRLNKLSVAVDKMWDAEIQAQVKYTGSGPVSRAQ